MLCPAIYGLDRLRPSVCRRFGTLRNRKSRIFDTKRHARVEFCIAASAIHDPRLDQSVMTVIGQDSFSFRPRSNVRCSIEPLSPATGQRPRSSRPIITSFAVRGPLHQPRHRTRPKPAISQSRGLSLSARAPQATQTRPISLAPHSLSDRINSTLSGATPDQYAARPTRP